MRFVITNDSSPPKKSATCTTSPGGRWAIGSWTNTVAQPLTIQAATAIQEQSPELRGQMANLEPASILTVVGTILRLPMKTILTSSVLRPFLLVCGLTQQTQIRIMCF